MNKKNWKSLCSQCESLNGSCLLKDIGVCPEDDDLEDIGFATIRELNLQNEELLK